MRKYKITYKDGSVQIVEAESYKLYYGIYTFRDDHNEVAAAITGSEVRSISFYKEDPVGIA